MSGPGTPSVRGTDCDNYYMGKYGSIISDI